MLQATSYSHYTLDHLLSSKTAVLGDLCRRSGNKSGWTHVRPNTRDIHHPRWRAKIRQENCTAAPGNPGQNLLQLAAVYGGLETAEIRYNLPRHPPNVVPRATSRSLEDP